MGDPVDAVERRLRGKRDREAGEQCPDDADRQREAAALERTGLDLVADDRDLAERAVQDRVLRLGVALEHEAEHRHEHEQQREQREEAVVGDQGGEASALIVAELLDDRDRHRQPAMAALQPIERLDRPENVHRHLPLPGGTSAEAACPALRIACG